MNVNEVLEIKKVVKAAQEECLKSQGAIDSIKKGWKETYGTDDEEELKKLLKECEDKKVALSNRQKAVYDELSSVCDWDALKQKLEIK